VRFRRRGISIYLTGTPWSDDFMLQYAAALDGVKAQTTNIGADRTVPGTVNAVIVSYYKLVFPLLKPSTQAMRRNILERFRRDHGNKPVARLEHEHVASIIAAKANTPEAANNLRKVLRHLLEHAIAVKMIAHNPVIGVGRFKNASSGLHCWTDDEIKQYRAYWPIGTQQRLAMELALETTSRRTDVTRIGPQHERNGKLDLRHTKNNSEALIPITPVLRAAIDGCPTKHLTFLHTRAGAPRSPKALGGAFRKWCDAAGLPKRCTIHGLRKGGARRLAEAGATAHEIMSITGHKTLSEVQRYTAAAEREHLAEQAIAKLSERVRTKQHAELSNLPSRLDKTAPK